jgi:transposase
MTKQLIRTSQHSTSAANAGKLVDLHRFMTEARRYAQFLVDSIWHHGYTWEINGVTKRFDISQNLLEFPSFIDYSLFDYPTILTARARSTIATQVVGIIKASTEKQRKRLYVLEKRKDEGASKKQRRALIKAIKTNIPQKPSCERLRLEVSSKCGDWQDSTGEFMGFLRLKSIFADKTEINIPISRHQHSNTLSAKGQRMNSFLVSENEISVRWSISQEMKTGGVVVGVDQGFKDVATLSTGANTPKTDIHGHSLESILRRLATRKKGSKAFKRSQQHRKNFINWSINKLNLSEVKELRLEEITNIGFKSNTSRLLSHWTNTEIRDKIESKCEIEGIRLVLQSSTYRSQRCSVCGVVRKANRKGKIYSCKHCGHEMDADLNASLNHLANLPDVPYSLRKLKLNRGNGFYWLETGFFDFATGRSIESLPPVEPIQVEDSFIK